MSESPIDPPVPLPPAPVLRPDAQLAQAAQVEQLLSDKLRQNIEQQLEVGAGVVSACGGKIADAIAQTLEATRVAYEGFWPNIESRLLSTLGAAATFGSEAGCEMPDFGNLPPTSYVAPPPLPSLLQETTAERPTGQGGLMGFPIPQEGGVGAIEVPEVEAVPIDGDNEFELDLPPEDGIKPPRPLGGIGPIPLGGFGGIGPIQPVPRPQGGGGVGQIPVQPPTSAGSGTRPTRPNRPTGSSGQSTPGGTSGQGSVPRPPSQTGTTPRPTSRPPKPTGDGAPRPPGGQQDGQETSYSPMPGDGGSPSPIATGGAPPVAEESGNTSPVSVTVSQEDGDVTVNVNVEQHCSTGDEGDGNGDEEEEEEEEEEEGKVEGDQEKSTPNIPILARILDDDIDKTCLEMKRLFAALKNADDPGIAKFKTLLTDTDPDAFERWWADQKTFGPDWMNPLKAIYQFLLMSGQVAAGAVTLIMGQECDKDPGPYVLRWIIQFLQRWLGDGVKDTVRQLDYMINFNCPTLIPSTQEANRLYFLGDINQEIWDCWTRMNGDKPDIQNRVVQSMRVKPSVQDYITLAMREEIDPKKLMLHARHSGARDENDIFWLQKLRKHYPPIDAILRFMVRDTFVDEIALKYGYDEDFETRFPGKAEKFAKAQGFDTETAKLYWRAHWRLPSPSQAYEMMFRLRPGRVPTKIETTKPDVEQLLLVADYPEYWRERLIAISHRKLRILDVRKAFYNGQITRAEMTERGMDIGYTRTDAEAWSRIQIVERLEWWTKQRWGKYYLEGSISEEVLRTKLEVRGMPPGDIEEVVNYLKEILEAERRKTCVDALHDRVLIGDLSALQAGSALVAYGLDVYQAEQIVLGWECEKVARLKFEGASKLAKWAVDGLLSLEELTRRLVAIGYVGDDINRILREVQIRQAENARKARERVQKERQRRADKRRRERERQLREADRARKIAEREQDRQKRLREKLAVRERQCNEVWAELAGIGEAEARVLIRAEVERFRKVKKLSRLASLDLVCGVLRDAKRLKLTDPSSKLQEAFDAIEVPKEEAKNPDPFAPVVVEGEEPAKEERPNAPGWR